MRSGLWVLGGVLIFTIVEKIFSGYVNADEGNPQPKCVNIANCLLKKSGELGEGKEGLTCAQNGSCDIEDVPNGCFLAAGGKNHKEPAKKIAGYLNLIANSIDNFTHGLAVAGSFLVSFRHGVLGTFAILCKFDFVVISDGGRYSFELKTVFQCTRFRTRSVISQFYFDPDSVDGTQPKLNYWLPVLDCWAPWWQLAVLVWHLQWKHGHRGLCHSLLAVSCIYLSWLFYPISSKRPTLESPWNNLQRSLPESLLWLLWRYCLNHEQMDVSF